MLDLGKLSKLTNDIRDSALSGEPVKTQLETSERIIARVTDGIYREPWAAFRELIANAYDADASRVVIETDAPSFEHIMVRDDGIGMSPRTLVYVLKHIGGSSKRTAVGAKLNTASSDAQDKSPGGRPLIGKIGIGLFAVAQLTQQFQIITKCRGDALKTSATVTLHTHNEGKFEDNYVAGEVTITSETVPEHELGSQGTSIFLYTLRPEVQRTMRSTRRWDLVLLETEEGETIRDEPLYHIGVSEPANEHAYKRDPVLPWEPADTPEEKFRKLFDAASNVSGRGPKTADLEHFDEYLKLVWKLSLSLPVEYIDVHPFDIDGSTNMILFDVPRNSRQANYIRLAKRSTLRNRLKLSAGRDAPLDAFRVTLDGIALQRPVRLPSELVTDSRLKAPVMMVDKQDNPFDQDVLERAGGRLSFEAYLYWNSRIVPKDTAGVLIRIREASGTLFDRTFLNYQVSEQTRLRQITAEIFVHEGLDSALNIDRESFNYSHPHFLYIQRWLHRSLRLLVNRLKAISAEDRQQEKVAQRHETQTLLHGRASEVWRRRHGEEADPPVRDVALGTVPTEIGGVNVEWPDVAIAAEPERVTALAVVLEAYGALSNLPVEERSRLIEDVVFVFTAKK